MSYRPPAKGVMTSNLERLMANLSDSERDRLRGAFAADPELAQGLRTMLADLPAIRSHVETRRGHCSDAIPSLERSLALRDRLGMVDSPYVSRMTDLGLAQLRSARRRRP
jgi:hypothetical protein